MSNGTIKECYEELEIQWMRFENIIAGTRVSGRIVTERHIGKHGTPVALAYMRMKGRMCICYAMRGELQKDDNFTPILEAPVEVKCKAVAIAPALWECVEKSVNNVKDSVRYAADGLRSFSDRITDNKLEGKCGQVADGNLEVVDAAGRNDY